MKVTLFRYRVFADVINLRSCFFLVGPKCNHKCPIRGGRREKRETEDEAM